MTVPPTAVTVFGLGYVGSVSAASLASQGFRVTGVDLDPRKTEMVNRGRPPIVEPGLAALVSAAVAGGRLRAVTRPEPGDLGQVVFVCVGTPSTASGAPNVTAVAGVLHEVRALAPAHRPVVAIRSTIPPGTTEGGQAILGDVATVCANPEFMREGHGVDDFLRPPFVIVGAPAGAAVDPVIRVYEHLGCEVVRTGPREAEMLKYVSNSWHATKVAFANEIGALAKSSGVDVRAVMNVFLRDRRLNLSAAYLRPGAPFGGSCLPKDLRALVAASAAAKLDTPLLDGVVAANEAHMRRCLGLVEAQDARRLAWLGLAFKDGTDDLRESPPLRLIAALMPRHPEMPVYDPVLSRTAAAGELLGANRRVFDAVVAGRGLRLCTDVPSCVAGADVVVLCTRDQAVTEQAMAMPESVRIVDLVNDAPVRPRPNYVGLCWADPSP